MCNLLKIYCPSNPFFFSVISYIFKITTFQIDSPANSWYPSLKAIETAIYSHAVAASYDEWLAEVQVSVPT